MNVGNSIFLKLYLAMPGVWIPHKVWAAILSYDLTSSLGWDNSFHMSNSVASQRHLATSLWNLKRDEGGIGLQQEKNFSRRVFLNTGSSSASFVVRLRWDARGVGWKSIPLFLFPSRDTLSRTFHRGGSCRMQMWGDSAISLALRRQGCTSHWRLEGDDCYKMQLRETLVFCLASRRQGLQGGDSSHWWRLQWRHTPVIQIGTPLAEGSHWC